MLRRKARVPIIVTGNCNGTALRPEIGVMYEVNPDFSFSVTGKYYLGFEAGDLNEPINYFALNIGFVFTK